MGIHVLNKWMERYRFSKQKSAPRHTVACGHKSATFDGIKLSMTNLRNYIVIVPPCLRMAQVIIFVKLSF